MRAIEGALDPVFAGIDGSASVELEEIRYILTPATEWHPSPAHSFAKRTIDIAGSLLVLLVSLPVMIVAAMGVKLSSPGPILFRQERVGLRGRHFMMVKFRTFPIDHVDETQSLPVAACPLGWGRFLRRTSIDELPQMFNVLIGHMSLVGPRPERPQFAVELANAIPTYPERHRVRGGITGMAQIRGLCGPTSIDDRVAIDNEYIDGWTVWRDLRILLFTVPAVFRKLRW